MKENILITVVIVNYNGKKYLKKCLDSLFEQSYTNIEIIFVDNNSDDDSVVFLKQQYSDQRLIIIEHQENSGFATGNNIGISNARGEYILLINNDTWVEKDFIRNIYTQYLESQVDVKGPVEVGYEVGSNYENDNLVIDIFGHPVHMSL